MSKIALTPNASGSGTFTIASPNSNTDRVLTLPDEAGTVLTSASSVTNTAGPLFSATSTGSNVLFSNATNTKVIFDVETYDTDSCFDTTNYRFTPNVAGYYFFHAAIYSNWNGSNHTQFRTMIYKNGSVVLRGHRNVTGTDYGNNPVSGIIEMNGSSDYVEVYVYADGGSSPTYTRTSLIHRFSGHLVRGA